MIVAAAPPAPAGHRATVPPGPILIAVFAGLLLGEGFPRRLLAGMAIPTALAVARRSGVPAAAVARARRGGRPAPAGAIAGMVAG